FRRGRALLRRRLFARFLCRRFGAAVGEEFLGSFGRYRFHIIVFAQRRVVFAVGDIRAEPAVLEDDRLAADGIVTELLERGLCCLTSAGLRLGEQFARLILRDRQQVFFAVQRTRVRALLQIRAVTPVLRGHFLTVLFCSHNTRLTQ